MKRCEYDGQQVLHVDGANIVHSGIVIGQSDDEQQVYVHSDRSGDPDRSHWHFAVDKSLVPVLMKNAKTLLSGKHRV